MVSYLQENNNIQSASLEADAPDLGKVDFEDVSFEELSQEEKQQKQLKKDVRRASMNMLARREHSLKELKQKLLVKFPLERKLVGNTLLELEIEGLQSDLRFSEGYLRWRANKGFGRDRISMELNQKGVVDDIVEEATKLVEIDWDDLLEKQYQKKYHSRPPQTLEEKSKYIRFFLYRGFSHSQIKALLK